jgi:hypothetical protein
MTTRSVTWPFSLLLAFVIAAALMPNLVVAADGVRENAANGDPCGGIRPCDLGGEFTIDELLQQKPYPIRGVCESRCFWQAVVTNSCFEPDAIIDIHAPVDPNTGKLNQLAADILVRETKAPGVQRYLRNRHAQTLERLRTERLDIGSVVLGAGTRHETADLSCAIGVLV